MKVFMAGVESLVKNNIKLVNDGYNLVSYFAINTTGMEIIRRSKIFFLDSGAYSFLNSGKKVDLEQYIDDYANFINKNHIQHFFELDIDKIVGYPKVKEFRKKLEVLTGRQCIPVWHKGRGIEEWKKMCDEYSYVAIGGIVTREIKPDQYKAFPLMITEAHKRGAKVHGLGFTSTKLLKVIHFDSVDSTNWSYGRYGHYWEFTKEQDMVMHHRPFNKRCSGRGGLQAHNIGEWIKFQKYADTYL